MDCQSPSINCWRTAPTAISEASVMMHVGVAGTGCVKRVASARAVTMVLKASIASVVHSNLYHACLWNAEGDEEAA